MENKKVYIYADNGNEYAGSLILDDSDKSPSGKWNIPGFCTEIEPPVQKEGFLTVWNGTTWEYKEAPKEPVEPEPTLEEVKEAKIAEMKAERDLREVQDIEYNGKTYDYDDKSRERLSRAQQYLEDNGLESILWTCADNTVSLLSIEDFKNINTISATRSSALHEQYNRLKIYINGLTSTDEVNAVTFDTDVSSINLYV